MPEAEHILPLFQVLSNTEDVNDYDEFELDETLDDDANVSVVSSTMGSVASVIHDFSVEDDFDNKDVVEEDWERLEEGERNATINSTLKRLGNVTKKLMTPLILKDLLGEDGDLSLKNIMKSHQKRLSRNKMVINDVYRFMKYFGEKFDARRECLKINTAKSKAGNYQRRNYMYRNDYDLLRASHPGMVANEDGPPPLLQGEDIPNQCIEMIKAASSEVFGITSPRTFQYICWCSSHHIQQGCCHGGPKKNLLMGRR